MALTGTFCSASFCRGGGLTVFVAHLVIAATAIPRRARLSWLRDIASRVENPSAQLATTPRHAPAAATPCTSTALKLSESRGRGHARAASNGLQTHGILPTKSTTAAADRRAFPCLRYDWLMLRIARQSFQFCAR